MGSHISHGSFNDIVAVLRDNTLFQVRGLIYLCVRPANGRRSYILAPLIWLGAWTKWHLQVNAERYE